MASSTIGTAVIKLSFDGSDVKAELTKTSTQFKNAGAEAGSQFGNALTVAMGSLISKGVAKVVGTITNNLDSAINRVDVINNFPRVMESLGFSTDEAASAIKTISDRLDGLPSTLNGVVSDVQKLTATMGNLNTGMVNATSLGLALNDMFLAGGKGTEAASLAMEQYNQMLAQGKPDMQSWRSILNAAPGQLKQLAKTLLGAAAGQNELYEALKDGTVTFDQLNEAIVRLDQEGGEGFDSFEKQARSATGGVGTALENVQNRISKAIAKVIDTIGADNIANAINDISSHFGEIGVEVGKFVKSSMENIGNFTRFLSQNMWITDVIKGAVAGIIALGIGNKIMELQKKASSLFAFLSAHPFVALASAIAGVVVGITNLVSHEDKLTASIKKSIEATSNATKEYHDLENSRKSSLQASMNEIRYYEDLKNELGKIVDGNGRVREGYEARAKYIVNQLREALGIEIELNDNVIEGYEELSHSMDKIIEKKYAEVQLNSEEEAYSDALKKRAASMDRIVELQRELTQAKQSDSWVDRMKVEGLEKAISEETELYKRYSWDIQRYTDDMAAFLEGRYDDMSEAVWDYSDVLYQSDTVNQIQLEHSLRDTESKLNTVEELYRETGLQVYADQRDSYTRLVGEIKEKMGQYQRVTDTSMQAVHDGFCRKIDQTVIDTTRIAGGFASVGQKGGSAIASGFNSKSGAISSSVNDLVNKARDASWGNSYDSGWNLGNRIGWGTADGISSSAQSAVNAAYNLMNRLREITGQTLPGPKVEGFRQTYNFATQSYEYVPMASGGFVSGATRALVGEAGQEVVLPLQQNTNNWSGLLANAIMEQMEQQEASNTITVYMNNTIDNDMSIDELGRQFSQSIRRYA